MFFHFSQNNSGGSFSYSYPDGITHHVIIEADSADKANKKAEDIGLYFGGCNLGYDCDCCGDRWYEQYSDKDGTPEPAIYGQILGTRANNYGWMKPGRETVVHFADGTRKWYNSDNTLADEQ